ncbi:hypothetical protein L207DRAFT_575927 [Hyaloscypha variabilis F]|jgi:hypothetical protein|uniref:Uncharacterized protein n=1 Tax=Hyaloscypha variabilis (strain UAMH 11265 / GT02V1 / F) TaxID=1149755 RepID=A0A2J6S8P2_HYAVF|nr:hypothetical protein L207DRAFT_575927 [Hyaloscypha variabilis F]
MANFPAVTKDSKSRLSEEIPTAVQDAPASSEDVADSVDGPRKSAVAAFFSDWKWELAAMLLALSLFVAIIALIASQDKKYQTSSTINLNSQVAILSTIFRPSLVFPVVQGNCGEA